MRKFDSFHPEYQNRICRRMVHLAYRMVDWSDDMDPYGFMDACETGESFEEASERMVDTIVREM
jgi:hypothetical protein